ncbi:MAG: right-handed parallel beta-helix repeat-containing protein, partial [Candidatus Cloacimonetes bacterium]|nr:right-handed parallel beta-helix repeat-containing protein [Candidatus Cloacimonadota bacterium]
MICLNSSNLLIQNSVFTNNKSSYGGAIALSNSSPTFHDLIIEDNYASHDGGGIFIAYNSNPNIENTLITHNLCFCDGGGVFICGNSNPTLENCTISQNEAGYEYDCGGAGAVVWGAQATFDECLIAENQTTQYCGGIWIGSNSQVEMNNSIIARNHASEGAGIVCNYSDLSLSGTSVFYNVALCAKGGISSYETNIIFDQNNRSSIYSNIALNNPDCGIDIFNGSQDLFDIYLDTFTVAVPTEVYAYPLVNFTFDIQNHVFEPAASNLYVSVNGSNTNSGLTPSDPIKSISQAVQMIQPDSLNLLTIYIEDGVYSPSLTDEVFPISLKSYLTLQGSSKLNTILDAENTAGIFRLEDLTGVNINDLTITQGYETGYSCGGGITCDNSSLNLLDVIIKNCYSCSEAGGISIAGNSILNLAGTSIFHNTSNGQAGAINRDNGTPIIYFDPVNLCNIYLNESYYGREIYWYESPIHVIVDTFTVLNPDATMVYPLSYFTFDIDNAIYEPVAADLYVSPNGSNSNSGLSSAEPLKTIQRALQMIISNQTESHTIYLADGVYSLSSNGEFFPLFVDDYITISGASRNGTIINAEETNQVITISGDYVRLEYFTVTNGLSSYGAGICINGNDAELFELTIKDNSAVYNSLYYNYGFGGGICVNSDNTIFQNLLICDNFALNNGGGTFFHNSANLKNVTIKDNVAGDLGGGIYCEENDIVFDDILRSNIYNNLSYALPNIGNDIYFLYDENLSTDMHVNVDTFTVQYPNDYFAYPTEHMIFDIQNYILSSIEADVYVSPDGLNSNSGLTADDPFRSITYALQRVYADSLNPSTIHLAAGTYSPVINGESFPLIAYSYITIQGESKENTF